MEGNLAKSYASGITTDKSMNISQAFLAWSEVAYSVLHDVLPIGMKSILYESVASNQLSYLTIGYDGTSSAKVD